MRLLSKTVGGSHVVTHLIIQFGVIGVCLLLDCTLDRVESGHTQQLVSFRPEVVVCSCRHFRLQVLEVGVQVTQTHYYQCDVELIIMQRSPVFNVGHRHLVEYGCHIELAELLVLEQLGFARVLFVVLAEEPLV